MRHIPRAMARSPYFCLSILGCLWGANFLFMKNAGDMAATRVVWFRLFFGALALVPFMLSALPKLRRTPMFWLHVSVMSLAANVVTFHCFMEGTQRLGAGTAGVISGAIPLMTALLAALLLPSEKLNGRGILGLLLSFAGIAGITTGGNTGSGAMLSGAVYMLAGALGYAVAFVYARRFLTVGPLSALELAAMQMLVATVLYAPLAEWHGIEEMQWNLEFLGNVALGLGVLGSGLAYVIYYSLIESLGAVAASSVTYLPPLVALVLGWTVLHEPVHPQHLVGTALVLSGIFLLRSSRRAI